MSSGAVSVRVGVSGSIREGSRRAVRTDADAAKGPMMARTNT
jgi:hypothetical protein